MSASAVALQSPAASPDWLALIGVAATAGLSFPLRALGATAFFIGAAIIFWTAYVILRTRQDGHALHNWGFRTDNLRTSSLATLGVFLAFAAGFALYGFSQGYLILPWDLPQQLVVYSVWGLIQQFLALGIVVSNLERLALFRNRRYYIVVPVALIFGSIHLYEWHLAVATFIMEMMIIPLYLRYRNLWPLGVLHGWLGAFFYLWVLGKNLWPEVTEAAMKILGQGH